MNEEIEFNLIDVPWLPVEERGGGLSEVGLRDALARAHEVRGLWGATPMMTVALHRLLLAVLHRVFGPTDADAWGRLWQQWQFDVTALDEYLEHWRGRFDLFALEHPFFQRKVATSIRPINKMLMHLPAGGNPTLRHVTDEYPVRVPASVAARNLVTTQAFALAGGNSGLEGRMFTDSTLCRSIVFLLQGKNLFETLMLNLVTYSPQEEDVPVWERDDSLDRDPLNRGQELHVPVGLLDLYTWPSRRIYLYPLQIGDRLFVEHMRYSEGLRLAHPPLLDPMVYYKKNKKRVKAARYVSWTWGDRALIEPSDEDVPTAFHQLVELVEQGHLQPGVFSYSANGLASKQGLALWDRSSVYPLPIALQGQAALMDLFAGRQLVWRKLWGGLATLWDEGRGENPGHREAWMHGWRMRYWERYRRLLRRMAKEDGVEWWSELRSICWRVLGEAEQSIGSYPNALRAGAKARSSLSGGLTNAAKKLEINKQGGDGE